LITAGGVHDELCYWETKEKSEKPILLNEMFGIGITKHAVSLNNDKVAFTDTWTANQGMSKLNRTFNLFQKTFNVIDQPSNFNKPQQKQGDFGLTTFNEGGYTIVNPKLIVTKAGTGQDTISRDPWSGSRHNVYTFTPNGEIISGGSQGVMSAYDKKGNELCYFIGHEGDIWGASISKDGERLITCSTDSNNSYLALRKGWKRKPKPFHEVCLGLYDRHGGRWCLSPNFKHV